MSHRLSHHKSTHRLQIQRTVSSAFFEWCEEVTTASSDNADTFLVGLNVELASLCDFNEKFEMSGRWSWPKVQPHYAHIKNMTHYKEYRNAN